jgi:hypothetical protein
MNVTESSVLDALRVVRDPDLNRDIVALKFIKNLRIDGERVSFSIELTTPACPVKDQMRDQLARQSNGSGRRISRDEMMAPCDLRWRRTNRQPFRSEHHRGWRRREASRRRCREPRSR